MISVVVTSSGTLDQACLRLPTTRSATTRSAMSPTRSWSAHRTGLAKDCAREPCYGATCTSTLDRSGARCTLTTRRYAAARQFTAPIQTTCRAMRKDVGRSVYPLPSSSLPKAQLLSLAIYTCTGTGSTAVRLGFLRLYIRLLEFISFPCSPHVPSDVISFNRCIDKDVKKNAVRLNTGDVVKVTGLYVTVNIH